MKLSNATVAAVAAIPRHDMMRKGFQRAPIPIQREPEVAVNKEKLVTFKCRNVPEDPTSTQFELSVLPFNGDESPETWFRLQEKANKVIKGQNLTTGPQRYEFYRRILTGKALARFEETAATAGTETIPNLRIVLQGVMNYVLPARALQTQKRYMRRLCRKPPEMTMKEYISRFQQLNSYLAMFDSNRGALNKLPNDEIIEHAEFAIPASWRQQMILQGFEPIDHTLDEFTQFCERLEFTEKLHEANHVRKPKPDGAHPPKGKRDPRMDHSKPAAKRGHNEKTPPFKCAYHGPNWSHNTGDCKMVVAQAQKMASAHGNFMKNGDKKPRYGNRTWVRDDGGANKKEELHAMIQNMVKDAVKDERKRKAVDPPDEENFNVDELLANLVASDDEN